MTFRKKLFRVIRASNSAQNATLGQQIRHKGETNLPRKGWPLARRKFRDLRSIGISRISQIFAPDMTTLAVRRTADFERELIWGWMDSVHLGVVAFDASGTIVVLNHAVERLCGSRADQALGQHASQWCESLGADALFTDWLLSHASTGQRELTLTKDGVERHFAINLSTVKHASGEPFRVVGITEITEIQRLQAELDRQKRHWEAMNAGVVISDVSQPDMPIIYVNRKFEQMSGYQASEVIGKNCRFLQGADQDQPALELLRLAIKNQTNGYALLRNYKKDGTPFLNELFISPVRDHRGVTTHMIGVQHERAWSGGGEP